MGKFMSHEGLANGVFDEGYCSASGVLLPWENQLTNTISSLQLLVERLSSDYQALNPKMRKPYHGKDIATRIVGAMLPSLSLSTAAFLDKEICQRRCGLFLAATEQFQKTFPSEFEAKELPGLRKACFAMHPIP